MLKLDNIIDIKPTLINFDDYIPLNIDFNNNENDLIYNRFGNGNTSLLEISLDSNSFLLNDITLVNIGKKDISNTKGIEFTNSIYKKGFPVFNEDKKNIYSDYFNKSFKLFIGLESLYINFTEENSCFFVENDGVLFGFNKNRFLNSIGVLNLLPVQIEIFQRFN